MIADLNLIEEKNTEVKCNKCIVKTIKGHELRLIVKKEGYPPDRLCFDCANIYIKKLMKELTRTLDQVKIYALTLEGKQIKRKNKIEFISKI